ncbi:hypothetical protein D3C72_594950 [compost metagenome]
MPVFSEFNSIGQQVIDHLDHSFFIIVKELPGQVQPYIQLYLLFLHQVFYRLYDFLDRILDIVLCDLQYLFGMLQFIQVQDIIDQFIQPVRFRNDVVEKLASYAFRHILIVLQQLSGRAYSGNRRTQLMCYRIQELIFLFILLQQRSIGMLQLGR